MLATPTGSSPTRNVSPVPRCSANSPPREAERAQARSVSSRRRGSCASPNLPRTRAGAVRARAASAAALRSPKTSATHSRKPPAMSRTPYGDSSVEEAADRFRLSQEQGATRASDRTSGRSGCPRDRSGRRHRVRLFPTPLQWPGERRSRARSLIQRQNALASNQSTSGTGTRHR